MSRWRRQQRKRSRIARELRRLDLSLDQHFQAIRAEIARATRAALAHPWAGAPITARDVSKHLAELINGMSPVPETRTTVRARLSKDSRSLSLDVTVTNPSAPLAEALLAAGGHWVEPRVVQEFDFGFTFKPCETE